MHNQKPNKLFIFPFDFQEGYTYDEEEVVGRVALVFVLTDDVRGLLGLALLEVGAATCSLDLDDSAVADDFKDVSVLVERTEATGATPCDEELAIEELVLDLLLEKKQGIVSTLFARYDLLEDLRLGISHCTRRRRLRRCRSRRHCGRSTDKCV